MAAFLAQLWKPVASILYGGMVLEGEGQSFSEGGTDCRDHLGYTRKFLVHIPMVIQG